MDKLNSLIEQCKSNNRKAQSELYALWFSPLMRIARKYKNNEEDAASIVNDSLIGAPPGKSGIWDKQICSFDLKSGLGPYKIKVFIEDYDARGGGTLEKYTDISFTARPGSAGSASTPKAPDVSSDSTKSLFAFFS